MPPPPPPPVAPSAHPFAGPVGEWTWEPIAGTQCAQGSETGFGYKRGLGDKVFIYMAGGSVCLDEECTSSPFYTKWTGYGRAQFMDALGGTPGSYEGQPGVAMAAGVRDLNSLNPTFGDASIVYIPYCSGDYFMGSADKDWGSWVARYRGKNNMRLFLQAIHAGFPDARRFVLSGGSAGAVGAVQNYHQAVETFGGKRVDLVSDSFSQISESLPQFFYPVTGPVLPPGCAECSSDSRSIYRYDSALASTVGGRIAIVDSEGNWTLDWALALGSQKDYTKGLDRLQGYLDPLPNVKYYVAGGSVHVLMNHPFDSSDIDVRQRVSGSLARDTHYLSEFLTRMQNDDPGWQSLSVLRDDLLSVKTECEGRTCGPDAAGGTCGTCPTGWTCDANQRHCEPDR